MVDEDDILAIRREIERIHDRIDGMRHVQAQQVRADPRVRDAVLEPFTGKGADTMAALYFAVDGKRNVNEIADAAEVHRVTASRKLSALNEVGLIEPNDVGGTKVYRKSVLEKALHITRHLKQLGHTP